jgi:hypothetical protein
MTESRRVPAMPECDCRTYGLGGYHCRRCCLTFTTLSAFLRHLVVLDGGAGYAHLAPEDCGLVITPKGAPMGADQVSEARTPDGGGSLF